MNRDKMMKTARNFDIGAKVVGGIMGVTSIVMVVFAVLVLILKDKLFQQGSLSLDMEFATVYLTDAYQVVNDGIVLHGVVVLLLLAVIFLVISYGCKLVWRILAPMCEGRPFEESVPANLRKIAWTVLAGGLLMEINKLVDWIFYEKHFPLEKLFAANVVEKVEYSHTIDFGFVFAGCMILLLSYVFAYGQQLQKESDETL